MVEEFSRQVFTNKINLIGKKLKNGTQINDYIVNGLNKEPFNVMIYKGKDKYNNDVAIKFLYDEDIKAPLKIAFNNMNKLKDLNVPLYNYYLDYYDDSEYTDDDTNIFLVTELLFVPNKDDCFKILEQLIPVIWKYRKYMTHCDIKPDNIMCTKDHKKFYFIDYDSCCTTKFLYGYKRIAFTPQFASQSSVIYPTLITIKQDIIELIVSTHAIFYEKPFENSWYIFWEKYNQNYIFSLIFLIALNINENFVTEDDIKNLLEANKITENVFNRKDDLSLYNDKIQKILSKY